MPDFNDEISGIRVVGQVPLDAKAYSPNQATLQVLGVNSNLAYTYFEGMVVFCIEEKTRWEWREAIGDEVGLIDNNFVYPNGLVALGIDYSLRPFNFFELVCLPTPIAYLELRVIEKGVINGVPNVLSTLEVGDTVQGRKDEFTVWTSAIYNGGDPTDRDNYTTLVETMFVGDPGNLPSVNPYQGPSAYQVAVDNGYVGTVEEWLLSLEGADGTGFEWMGLWNTLVGYLPGQVVDDSGTLYINIAETPSGGGTFAPHTSLEQNEPYWELFLNKGKSAYEIAVANGYVGTEAAWLVTLIGNEGASAYQVAVSEGYVGDEASWLLSLEGTDGNDGVDASNNLQKDITLNYTLTDEDNNYVIQIFNGANPVTITVPLIGLRDKFNCGFIRKGTGEVLFVGEVGVTLLNSVGFRIKEQHDPAYIEKDKDTDNYALLGTTKA
jgi:hypothetical protein